MVTGSSTLNEKANVKGPEDERKHPLTGVSSDERFCGTSYSSLTKQMENDVASLHSYWEEVILVGIGEKIRCIFCRTHSDPFLTLFKDIGQKTLLLEIHQLLLLNC